MELTIRQARRGNTTKPQMNGVCLSFTSSRLANVVLTRIDLHLFATSQPDLNWDNPAVREAVYDVVNFWGSKGTDGFRVSHLERKDSLKM